METIVPKPARYTYARILFLIVLFVILIGVPLGLFLFRTPVPPTTPAHKAYPTRSTHVDDMFTEDEFVRGWYWGPEKAVKGTPPTWEMTKVGTKFCWHLPIVMCKE